MSSDTTKPTSKMRRFSGTTHALDQVARTLAAPAGDEGGYEAIPMDRIDLDPQNPRHLGLSATNPRLVADDDPQKERKLRSIEALEDLALSIASIGVITPIRVYRAGDRFRIAYGERRFLGSVMANKTTIVAIILKERPASLRLEQYVENAQRVDLDLPERLENLRVAIVEAAAIGSPVKTGEDLRRVVGLGRAQAFRYWAVINGPKEVYEAVQKGLITTIAAAAEVAAIADPILRNRAIKEGGKPVATVEAKQAPKRGAGRPPTTIRLGTTPRVDVIQRLVEAVAGPGKIDVDWTDVAAVTKMFKTFLKSMEDGKL